MTTLTNRPQTIGAKLKTIRYQRSISQQDLLAHQYSEAYLSRVERDHLYPSEDFLAFLAEQLGMTPDELVLDTAPKKPKIRKAVRDLRDKLLQAATSDLAAKQSQAGLEALLRIELTALTDELLPLYHRLLGQAKVELGQLEDGLADLTQALALYSANRKLPVLELEQTRNWMGVAYYKQGKVELALAQHHQCLEAVQQGRVKDSAFSLALYQNIATDYLGLGKVTEAIAHYEEAFKLASGSGDKLVLAQLNAALGKAYQADGKPQDAQTYLTNSIDIYSELELWAEAAHAWNLLGVLLLDQLALEPAETALKQGLKVATKAQNPYSLYESYSNLARVYSASGKLAEAEKQAEQSLKIAQKAKEAGLSGMALAQLGELKLAQGDVGAGTIAFDEAVKVLEQKAARATLQVVYYQYASALEKLDKLAEAMPLYRQAFALKG